MTVVFPLHKKKTSGKKIRDREALSMSDVNHQNAKERKKKLNLFLFSFHSEVSLWDWQIERRNKTAKGISFNVWSFIVLLFFFFFFIFPMLFFPFTFKKKWNSEPIYFLSRDSAFLCWHSAGAGETLHTFSLHVWRVEKRKKNIVSALNLSVTFTIERKKKRHK